MSDVERRRAEHEARDPAASRQSADRARLWASLNRYLGAEARSSHQSAEDERRNPGSSDRTAG